MPSIETLLELKPKGDKEALRIFDVLEARNAKLRRSLDGMQDAGKRLGKVFREVLTAKETGNQGSLTEKLRKRQSSMEAEARAMSQQQRAMVKPKVTASPSGKPGAAFDEPGVSEKVEKVEPQPLKPSLAGKVFEETKRQQQVEVFPPKEKPSVYGFAPDATAPQPETKPPTPHVEPIPFAPEPERLDVHHPPKKKAAVGAAFDGKPKEKVETFKVEPLPSGKPPAPPKKVVGAAFDDKGDGDDDDLGKKKLYKGGLANKFDVSRESLNAMAKAMQPGKAKEEKKDVRRILGPQDKIPNIFQWSRSLLKRLEEVRDEEKKRGKETKAFGVPGMVFGESRGMSGKDRLKDAANNGGALSAASMAQAKSNASELVKAMKAALTTKLDPSASAGNLSSNSMGQAKGRAAELAKSMQDALGKKSVWQKAKEMLDFRSPAKKLADDEKKLAKMQGEVKGGGPSSRQRREMEELNKSIEGQKKKLQDLNKYQTAVAVGYGLMSAKILGFVRSGLAGTTVGEHLSIQMQFLHREIAALFLPAIQSVIKWVNKALEWFRALSGEQQNSIGKWALITTGMLGILSVGPKLIQMFAVLKGALVGAFMANPMLAFVAAIGGLMAASEGGRESLMKMGEVALNAFGAIADLLNATFMPLIESLVNWLSESQNAFKVLGVVMVGFAAKFAISMMTMAGSLMTLQAAMGPLILIAGLLMAAFASSTSAIEKDMGRIASAVRTGKMTKDEAMKQVEDKAIDIGIDREDEVKKQTSGDGAQGIERTRLGMMDQDNPHVKKRLAELDALAEKIGNEARDEALGIGKRKVDKADKAKKDHQELSPNKTGFEDVKESFKRIQQAGLKSDPMLKVAEEQRKLQEKMLEELKKKNDEKIKDHAPPLPPPILGQ